MDGDRIQDILHEMGQINEIPLSVDLSTDIDTSSGLETGRMLSWVVLHRRLSTA
jgi:hypothetical protein